MRTTNKPSAQWFSCVGHGSFLVLLTHERTCFFCLDMPMKIHEARGDDGRQPLQELGLRTARTWDSDLVGLSRT